MARFIQWWDKYKKIFNVFSFGCIVTLTFLGYRAGIFTDYASMDRLLQKCGIFAPLLFVAVQMIQVVVPILPGAVGCLYGVLFWGAVKGFFLNYIGICMGSIWAFLIARSLRKSEVRKITGDHFWNRYEKYLLDEKRFEWIFAVLIFLPVAPDDFLCYLAGVTKIPFYKFVLIILCGKPLAILLYSMGLNQIFQSALGLLPLGG